MIQIRLMMRRECVGFQVCGHSGYAEAGSDIVCAAVSALTQAAVLGLSEVVKAPMDYELEEGSLACRLKGELSSEASAILQTMVLGLRQIAAQYPAYVEISQQEV